ncbi:hypothetical protein [Marisediminicola senii]|uniref:hypothetical protein n=1 Tax=Marisediminicola senii TaxID=2711233 RepID=UPI0013ECBD10|nr:hypothetical protein [Marisediminicola senii]
MSDTTGDSYPHGDAGPDSESGPVEDDAPDGADETVADSADMTADGSLSPVMTGDGSPTTDAGDTEHSVEQTAQGKPHAHATQHNPNALVEGGRVATAEDME